MKLLNRLMRASDSIESTLRYWYAVLEDVVLFPIAYFEMKRRSYFDLPAKLRFSLFRFGLHQSYDPKIHHQLLKERRTETEYDAMEILQKPSSRIKH